MQTVYRCFSRKKKGYDVEARALLHDLTEQLQVRGLTALSILHRYDCEGIDQSTYDLSRSVVFSEPQCDECYDEQPPAMAGPGCILCVESLPGQYDQRADSCAQCIQLLRGGSRPLVRAATVYMLSGKISKEDYARIKAYLINPVETRETGMGKPDTLRQEFDIPDRVPVQSGFTRMDETALDKLREELGLAMDLSDLVFLQDYFEREKRDPTLTEIRVADTYWSDHCRHTTFSTRLEKIDIEDARVSSAYQRYLAARKEVYGEDTLRPVTLMDVATMGARLLGKRGLLPMLDISDEINACTVKAKIQVDGQEQDWLLLFKNETHNHPTEIEPFGGAATCIGGAIRDPLSGRAYVYQAMRVTGAGSPLAALSDTLPGKLPQRKLTTTAAAGYSSYGNQIGLATGLVHEIYHPGYVAKRMEIGAVVGAAPAKNVVRLTPQAGDVVILLGGRTGRDGIGGATGSSKTHDLSSLDACAAEVQKGNAPEERKLQRLFRNPDVTRMIKRCNDFGAGGVSVAIGELADGLLIDLDKVPKKYEGLDGTELAISESQERMAVVVSAADAQAFLLEAEKENLEATQVAVVTEQPRVIMTWRGQTVVDLSRDFLSSNGAPKTAAVKVSPAKAQTREFSSDPEPADTLSGLAGSLSFCSRRGLTERFDGSIGAASVLMPFGGKSQTSPAQVMAAHFPVLAGSTDDCSVMAYGFDPELSQRDPFAGAACAVTESLAKLAASGCDTSKAYLTLQEYFRRLGEDPERWGLPFSALLGAFAAQEGLGAAAIGGKDSMSGSFMDLDVPNTLVSFAIVQSEGKKVLSPEFKGAGHPVYLFRAPQSGDGLPDFAGIRDLWRAFHSLCGQGKILSAWACESGGPAGGIMKMSFGNEIGFASCTAGIDFFDAPCGSLIAECDGEVEGGLLIGRTTGDGRITLGGESEPVSELLSIWEAPLEPVFPVKAPAEGVCLKLSYAVRSSARPMVSVPRPTAVIPVFPGTNCEYDTARALEIAGARPEIIVVRNLSAQALKESADALEKAIRGAQMVVLPGGFSGGDEPDGSGKFIASFFRGEALSDAVHDLLLKRDGLMLGICNGFQALIKLGLVPFGRIRAMDESCPTLTYNLIGRHQSRYVNTRVSSVKSPWLLKCEVGDIHTVPVSHGEGRFVASPGMMASLTEAGQIAFQYVDEKGNPSMDVAANPNGSLWAVEGITSPDGRVLGKMAHTERRGDYVAKNIYGNKYQPLFEGGVKYFK